MIEDAAGSSLIRAGPRTGDGAPWEIVEIERRHIVTISGNSAKVDLDEPFVARKLAELERLLCGCS